MQKSIFVCMATCILGQYNIPFVRVSIICFLC